MEINVMKQNMSVCRAVCHIKSDFTTECDIIVPDTKPDIDRVLRISARVKLTNSETQNDRVIVSGNIVFNILYLADGEEKCVKAIECPCGFSNLFQPFCYCKMQNKSAGKCSSFPSSFRRDKSLAETG